MRTVSFQGTRITNAERAKLAFQRRSSNSMLAESVEQALQVTEQNNATGQKAPRWWTVERAERGTPYVGDIFAFN